MHHKAFTSRAQREGGGDGRRSSYSHPTPPLSSSSLGWPSPSPSLACVLQSPNSSGPCYSSPVYPFHPSLITLKQPGCIIYLSLCYCLEIMKGAAGMGMLNHCVLGFCPANEWDGRVGRARRWAGVR